VPDLVSFPEGEARGTTNVSRKLITERSFLPSENINMLVNYLAEIWGISIVVICFVLLTKPKYLKRLFVEIENETTMLFLGIVSFVIGLAMILAYNVWAKNWQVIVTILGWLSLLKGLSALFFPECVTKWAKKMENAPFLPYALVAMVLIGLLITYLGFTA